MWCFWSILVVFILDLCVAQSRNVTVTVPTTKSPQKNILEKVAPEDFWCKLNCPRGTQHTMCIYSERTVTPYCWNIRKQMNAKLRSEILKWHNDVRNEVAGGSLGKTASNMNILFWDFELEQVAYRWAHQCKRSNDACRSTEHYKKVSQNIGWVSSRVNSEPPPTEKILEKWTSTKERYFNVKKNTYVNYQRSISPFTLMIRACLERIGCGEVIYVQGKTKRRFLVCNYAPGSCYEYDDMGDHDELTGTYRDKAFLVGEPCSRCPYQLGCHSYYSHYKYLCQRWYTDPEEQLHSPLELMEANSGCNSSFDCCLAFVVVLLFSGKMDLLYLTITC